MERLCVLVYEPSEQGKRLLHDVLSAYAISQDVEITIKWASPGAREDALSAAAAQAQLALLNAENASPAAGIGELIYRENPACRVVFYGEPSPRGRGELVRHFTGLFPARPVSYLEQPSEPEFTRAVDEAVGKCAAEGAFLWETRGVKYRIPYGLILYFRSDRNYVYVRLKGGAEYSFLSKLTEVEKRIPPQLFVRVHQSYLIRRGEIVLIDKSRKAVRLRSGEEIFISKAHYKETLEI